MVICMVQKLYGDTVITCKEEVYLVLNSGIKDIPNPCS